MAYGAARWERTYVEVIARHAIDGRVEPLTIVWADGRRFDIARIRKTCRGACLKTAGHAIRYDVEINRRVKHLYRCPEGWFVETRDDPDFARDPHLWDF